MIASNDISMNPGQTTRVRLVEVIYRPEWWETTRGNDVYMRDIRLHVCVMGL